MSQAGRQAAINKHTKELLRRVLGDLMRDVEWYYSLTPAEQHEAWTRHIQFELDLATGKIPSNTYAGIKR